MALEDEIINIENLPIANEINFGDFVLLETVQGTKLLDFKDFIIGAENVTFFDRLSGSTFSQVEFDELKDKVDNHETIIEPISSVNTEITRINELIENIQIDILNLKRYESVNTDNFIATGGVFATYFTNIEDLGTELIEGLNSDIYKGQGYALGESFHYKAREDMRMLFNFRGKMNNWDIESNDTPVVYVSKYRFETNEDGIRELVSRNDLGNSHLSHIYTLENGDIRFDFNSFAILNRDDVVAIQTSPSDIKFQGEFRFSGVRLD